MIRSTARRGLIASTLLAAAVAVSALGARGEEAGAVVDVSAEGGSTEVIAQALVPFDGNELHWTLTSLAISQTPAPIDSGSPSFLLSSGSVAVLVSTEDGGGWPSVLVRRCSARPGRRAKSSRWAKVPPR